MGGVGRSLDAGIGHLEGGKVAGGLGGCHGLAHKLLEGLRHGRGPFSQRMKHPGKDTGQECK